MFGTRGTRRSQWTSLPTSLTQPAMVLLLSHIPPGHLPADLIAPGHDGRWPLWILPLPARDCCDTSTTWILSTAPGLVVRTGKGLVVVDLDGDGSEQWLEYPISACCQPERAQKDNGWKRMFIGHASCEGGISTGTHLHIARKYNGEWVVADGPIPFVLSGWTVLAGDRPYLGKLVKGNKIIVADVNAQARALIYREDDGE